MSRTPRPLLALALSALVAPAVFAQEEEAPAVREVLTGEENAAVIFSPMGGYAPENYLKRFEGADGEAEWATQNRALAELIRRAPAGTGIRIGAFKLADEDGDRNGDGRQDNPVVDACFEAAERGCEVKLWLKGPPGLTYMVSGHERIAERANRWLRRRADQGLEDEWGDVQVMIGTVEALAEFGKLQGTVDSPNKWGNDMHQKFGIVGLSPEHEPGRNHAFLGTSNIGASSDLWHNEHRVFFFENAHATQRLWEEFARLWHHLGECRTWIDGDPAKGPNFTPEPEPVIRLADGSTGAETEDGPLRFRFTYEKRDGAWHRPSRDFVAAIEEAEHLAPGEVVWVAQFGFQIPSITRALEEAARANPEVELRIMCHMTEGGRRSAAARLATAGLPNLKVRVKWDSTKAIVKPGEVRPPSMDRGERGPNLLHHKTLVVGDRVHITGSYNFFGDADVQGEDIVIIRNHIDPAYLHLTRDTQAEFEAMWGSRAFMPGEELFAEGGLYDEVGAAVDEPGFVETLHAVHGGPQSVDAIHARVAPQVSGGIDVDAVREHLEVLERFRFAAREPDGRYRTPDPTDEVTHAGKPAVREAALALAPSTGLSDALPGDDD